MNINEWTKEIHQNAVNKGWWEEDRPFAEVIALCHSELSEALEEYRNGHGANTIYFLNEKPEGIAIELADVVIRIMDFFGKHEMDLESAIRIKHGYNKTRPYRHGNKVI